MERGGAAKEREAMERVKVLIAHPMATPEQWAAIAAVD